MILCLVFEYICSLETSKNYNVSAELHIKTAIRAHSCLFSTSFPLGLDYFETLTSFRKISPNSYFFIFLMKIYPYTK